jgi:TrmH family RNA methyltransferase
MLSKTQITFVNSLADKKFRLKYQCFVVEGNKMAIELLNSSYFIKEIFCTDFFYFENELLITNSNAIVTICTKEEIKKISNEVSPQDVLVLAKTPAYDFINELEQNKWYLALDTVQDPGNMGTILRIADWFGITTVFGSDGCADVYNPKVIRASMGSVLRVNYLQDNLAHLFQLNPNIPIYGAMLNGQTVTDSLKLIPGIILLGNESKGIAANLIDFIKQPITIPSFGHAESLNVAVAAGIICSHLIK